MKPAERINSLDGLRGVAILLVLFYHSWTIISGQKVMEGDNFILVLLYAGNTGVTLFFLLSGFLVTRPFIEKLSIGQLPSLRRYAAQRAIRILPTYYFVAFLGLLITQNFEQLLPVLMFTAKAHDVGYFSTVWWSLSTEIQFYVLVPTIFYLIWRFRSIAFGCGLLCALAAIYLCVIFKLFGSDGYEGVELKFIMILSVFGQLPAFLVGALIAFLHMKKHTFILEWRAIIFSIFIFISLIVVLTPSARIGALRYIWEAPWYVVLEAIIWGGLMWVLLMRRAPGDTLISNQVTRYLGQVSFSLYLIHMPVIQLVLLYGPVMGPESATLLAILLSLLAAQLLYSSIEKPSLSLKNKLIPAQAPQGYKV